MAYSTRGQETTAELAAGDRRADALPPDFLEWQRESRISLLQTVARGGEVAVRGMPPHLPVLASMSEDGSVNLATKGVGLVPRRELLAELTAMFRDASARARNRPPEETAPERLELLLRFYDDPGKFDESLLGGLEIFEGSTYANLRRDPRVSLLFTGEAPEFKSYQVDGNVEFVQEGDPYYEFLVSARELFARDRFHVPQRAYPHGYIVKVETVTTKTPMTRGP